MDKVTFKPSRALWEAVQHNGGRIAAGTICNVLFQICYIASGLLFGLMLEKHSMRYVWALTVVLLGTVLLSALQDIIDTTLIPNLYKHMNDSFMTAIITTFETRKTSPNTGKVVGLYSSLYLNAVELLILARESVLPALLSALTGAVAFFYVSPMVGSVYTVGIVIVVALFVLTLYILQKPGAQSEHCRLEQDDANTDMLLNIDNIFAMNMSKGHLNYFRRDLNRCLAIDRKYLNMTAGMRTLLNGVITILFAAVIAALFYASRNNKIKVTMVAGAIFIMAFVREYLFSCIYRLRTLSWYSSYLKQSDKDVREILETEDQTPVTQLLMTPPTNSTIVLDQVVVANRVRLPDLVLHEGERMVLRGDVGSGKSTMLNILFGKLPYTGSVTIGGIEVRDLDINVLRDYILLVPQSVTLFQNTVYYNVSYGNSATREQVQALLDRFDITFAQLDDQVGHLGENLSGGQRQILFLLRALLRSMEKTEIILLDEPTSALDPNTRELALKIIEELIGSRSAILVTHDEALERIATQVLKLKSV